MTEQMKAAELMLHALKETGCDTAGALERMADDPEFYASIAEEYLREIDLAGLRAAVDAGDAEEAFRLAHSMKGVLGNLGMTPLYDPIRRLTEVFRQGAPVGREAETEQMLSEVEAQYRRIREAIAPYRLSKKC